MNITQIIVGGLVALAVTLGVLAVVPTPEAKPQPPPKFSAAADIPSPYFQYGGVTKWAYAMDMRDATSTPCSFLSPAATSTLVTAAAVFDATIGYTTSWLWGFSTNPTATTTKLHEMATILSPDPTGSVMVATTSLTQLKPLTYVNFNLSTSSAGVGSNFDLTGRCSVEFRQV